VGSARTLSRVTRWTLILVAGTAGCTLAGHREAAAYSNASVIGKYRLTSTVKPYVKFAGGPKIGEGEIAFDGHGNLAGHQVFLGQHGTIRGTYQIEPDGTGTASMTTALEDGTTSNSALALQIQNDQQIKFVSDGLPRRGDWVSVQSLIAHGQPGLQGVLEKE
jgi:hypothetical protein